MIIRHNMAAMFSNDKLRRNRSRLSRSLEKLSSGYAVNRAGDNAAGLAVSEKMRSQIAGIDRASYNCEDAISMIQTFEGALKAAQALIQRCKILASQCANGTLEDDVDREAMELEYEQLCEEMNQIADTDFNGITMLNGDASITDIYYTEELIPYISEVTTPAVDENGDPVLDLENYRISAGFDSSSPFSDNGVFCPTFVNSSGSTVYSTYGSGTTSDLLLTINGTLTLPNGSTESFGTVKGFASDNIDIQSFSASSGNGYTCTKTYFIDVSDRTNPNPADNSYSDIIKINYVQRAVQRETYLTNSNGDILTDDQGNNIVTGKFWDLSYEIYAADDSSANFTLTSADHSVLSDTVFSLDPYGDTDERYYTSDTSGGPISNEKVYNRGNMISGFSSYYYSLDDNNFNDLSQKIIFSADNPPDEVRLGRWGNGFFINDSPIDNSSPDLGYVVTYNNLTPDSSGKITIKGESRGVANTYSDTNITPKLETSYRIERTPHEITYEIPGDDNKELIIQAGARTKDSVSFVFSYTTSSIGELEPDLNCTAKGLGMDKLSMKTQEDANAAIDRLDNSLNKLSMIRSSFGAAQNRLEHKVDNLNNTNENLTSAESRIRDTDMASEMTEFTKSQIISQSSQAMLAQANSLPQSLLSILGSE